MQKKQDARRDRRRFYGTRHCKRRNLLRFSCARTHRRCGTRCAAPRSLLSARNVGPRTTTVPRRDGLPLSSALRQAADLPRRCRRSSQYFFARHDQHHGRQDKTKHPQANGRRARSPASCPTFPVRWAPGWRGSTVANSPMRSGILCTHCSTRSERPLKSKNRSSMPSRASRAAVPRTSTSSTARSFKPVLRRGSRRNRRRRSLLRRSQAGWRCCVSRKKRPTNSSPPYLPRAGRRVAALDRFAQDGFEQSVCRAVHAAVSRAEELSE